MGPRSATSPTCSRTPSPRRRRSRSSSTACPRSSRSSPVSRSRSRPARAAARRVVRHPVRHRRDVGRRGDPDRLPAVVTALLSLGTQEIARRNATVYGSRPSRRWGPRPRSVRQDRDPHAQQDDRPRDGASRGRTGSLSPARAIPPRARSSTSEVHGSTSTPTCSRFILRRRCPRGRGADRRPHRRRPTVLGAKGGLDVDETRATYLLDRGGPVRLRVQVHGDVPRDDRTGSRGGRPLLREGRARRADCAAEPTGAPTGRSCRSPTTTGTWPSRRTTAWRRAARDGRRAATSTLTTFDRNGDLLASSRTSRSSRWSDVDLPRPEARTRSRGARAGIRACDHGRPRHDRRRRSAGARDRGARDHGRRVRGDERRRAAPSCPTSARPPGSPPRTRSGWSGCSSGWRTSSR